MSWPGEIIRISFYLLFILVPLIFLPNTSELFEFNKIIVTYLLTAVIAFAWSSQMFLEKKWIFTRTPLDIPILLFLGSQLVSLAFSIDPRTSILGYYSRFNGGLVSLVCYALLYWTFVTYIERKTLNRVIIYTIITSAIIAVYGILEHYGHSFSCVLTIGGFNNDCWVQDVQNRVFATLGQPNWLSAYISALIFIPLSALLAFTLNFHSSKSSPKPFNHTMWVIFLFLLSLCFVFTKSRSGFMGTGLGILVYSAICYLKFPHLKSALTRTFLALGITSLLILVSTSNPVRDLFVPSTYNLTAGKTAGPALEGGGTESGSIRKIVWTGAVKIWSSSLKNFLIGTGPETFTMGYYQYRPIEHNHTSEWELLYNKAHNEFLNYLATTGVLGLGTYLYLLFMMTKIFVNLLRTSPNATDQDRQRTLLHIGFFAGWITISVTNFWGFSVTIVQILMFLLPAFALVSESTAVSPPVKRIKISLTQTLGFFVILGIFSYVVFTILKYWSADTKYASGQYNLKAFTVTQELNYIISSFQYLNQAYELNHFDPPILSDLSITTAYMSILTSQSDATASAQLEKSALSIAQAAISRSPHHPNYYKSASRVAILLSTINPQLLENAVLDLKKAQIISPTDPRIPYNIGVVYRYQNRLDEARLYLNQALLLKPDFEDAKVALQEMASASATLNTK